MADRVPDLPDVEGKKRRIGEHWESRNGGDAFLAPLHALPWRAVEGTTEA